MCGICGFAGLRNDALLRAMAARLEHRGPDEDGFFAEADRVALGMRRLRVIDLSTGSQPVFSEDRSVAVVFNGEIYNFRELRAELEAKGHRFRTSTDTEVLVHLYEERGEEFPKYLRGMFAFALWDVKERKLMLARDQFGVKPLFYAQAGGKLFFASEIKSLLLAEEISGGLDPAALDAYFARLYIPAPLTAYKGIKKLEPAFTLVLKDGRAKLSRYWEPPRGVPALSERDCLEGVDDLLGGSVKEQLVSDVPLGLLLSGGMDSSTLLYYMSRYGPGPVRTFTVGYSGKDAAFSETAQARLLAEHFGSAHEETIISPDPRAVMEKLAAQFDEPFADASAIPTYLVTREARKRVTVALTGVGGDELFGGYPRHLGARLLPFYLSLPRALRAALGDAARLLPESAGPRNLPGRLKRFLDGTRGDFREAYERWISYLTEGERRALFEGGRLAGLPPSDALFPGALAGPDDIYPYELRNYLSDDLLCLADRASMANSLELRVPFLDVRLAEFMAGAPLSLRTRGFRLKHLLKKLMADRLPAEITCGAKRGFQVPLARWYGEELNGFAREILSSGKLVKEGYLSREFLGGLLAEHESGRRNLNDQIHAAVMFELWLGVNGKRAAAPPRDGIRAGGESLTIVTATDIIQSDDEGGSGRVAWETSKQLAALGHRVIVVTRGAAGAKDRAAQEGLEVYRYRGSPLRFASAARDILRRFGKVDALYLHHPYTGLLAQLNFRGVPSAYVFHSPWAEEYAIRARARGLGALRRGPGLLARRLMERRAIAKSGAVLAASVFMAERLKAAHGLAARVLPLGVDTGKFAPAADRAEVRRGLGIDESGFLVFTVRNLEPRMGLENLVEAAADAARTVPGTRVIIGGRGSLRAKLEGLIGSSGLSGTVRLAGYIPEEELPLYYQAADLFVLPTRELEGFGLVTLEALACGTPVLATPVAANVEVLGGFDGSLLLKGYGPAEIAAGITAFAALPEARKEALRARCRSFVEENYSWKKYASGTEKVLYEVLRRN